MLCHPEASALRESRDKAFAFAPSMKEHLYYVYIIANATRILYTGLTSNLHQRVWKHKNKMLDGFTSHFQVCRLVYFESFDDVRRAIDREKQIKRWRRENEDKTYRNDESQLARFERWLVRPLKLRRCHSTRKERSLGMASY